MHDLRMTLGRVSLYTQMVPLSSAPGALGASTAGGPL